MPTALIFRPNTFRPSCGPAAWADDGVIEAMELDGHPNLLAVQWHPELSAADDPTQQGLFNRLVALAGKA